MYVGYYSSVGSMLALQRQHEVIAANLARQGVAGHRAAVAGIDAERPAVTAQFSPGAGEPAHVLRVRTGVDFTQGALERDGNPLHLAIEGRALFRVRTPDGAEGFTRNGAFALQPDATLATAEGYTLLDEAGQPVNVPRADSLGVAPDGVLLIDGEQGARVGLAAFDDPGAALREELPGLFRLVAGAAPPAGPAAGDRVTQGALERSNVAPVTQMAAMIAAFRAYEANQRAVTAQDESTGRLLRATSPNLV